MNMDFKRKLPIPMVVKEMYPISAEGAQAKRKKDLELEKVFTGKSDRMLLVIGPCSADREDAVMDYITRLRGLQDRVSDKIVMVPRIFTNKPRTAGVGYMGMLHRPDPNSREDVFAGLIAKRKLHMRALNETGFSCSDELLYPEDYKYLSDLLSYVTVGARSVEDQFHRLTASGLDIPVGMKNPTSGDLSVMLNAIKSAQAGHIFIYRGWEVESTGNPLAHAILRGYVDPDGKNHSNYHFDNILKLNDLYQAKGLQNPALIVDVNHSNSGKQYLEQIPIAKEVIRSSKEHPEIKKLLKGLMIESYIEDGC